MVGTQIGPAIVAILVSMLLSSCSGSRQIVVASKNFTESVLLGEIAAQHLENRLHVKVDRRLNLGGTLLVQQSIIAGAVDVYPEYTGTAITSVLKLQASSDAKKVFETVAREYRQRFHVEWAPPLGFNNSFAMVIRGDDPANANLKTISDVARRHKPVVLGVGYEFVKRPDGLAGLLSTYDLKIDGSPKEMDLGLLYSAMQQKQIEMAAVSATDGLIDAMKLRVLEDDKHYFPPYEAAFLTRRPELLPVLSELSGKLTDSLMRKLNYEIDGQHRPVPVVAREFLSNLSHP